jgi:hypothetical protein
MRQFTSSAFKALKKLQKALQNMIENFNVICFLIIGLIYYSTLGFFFNFQNCINGRYYCLQTLNYTKL